MDAKLVLVKGESQPNEVQLSPPAVIGRSRDADIQVPHPLISRKHCQIVEGDDGKLMVRDLGSLNGTYVGKERVEQAVLDPGALLSVGPVTFQAIYGDYDPAAAANKSADDDAPDFEVDDLDMDADDMQPPATKTTPSEATTSDASGETASLDEGVFSDASDGDEEFDFEWLDEDENK